MSAEIKPMKTLLHKSAVLLGLVSACALSASLKAAVVLGDEIGLDFNITYTATNWNGLNATNSQNSAPYSFTSNAIRLSDGAATGVAFSVNSNGGGLYGISSTDNNVATTTGLPIGATRDILYFNNAGLSSALVFRLAGLNDSLTYNIQIYGGVDNTTTRPTTNWTNGSQTVSYNPKQNLASVTLTGLTSSGGILDLSAYTTGTGTAAAGIVNAMKLTAVPEPSTAMAFALGAGALILLRRRMRTK